MSERQQTIRRDAELKGTGLHTGNPVEMRLRPAGEGEGICFIRTDLDGRPRLPVGYDTLLKESAVGRCSSIGRQGVVIHTVEHFMSALFGLGLDNLTVEIDGNELPGLDGSSLGFVQAIRSAGVVEQDAKRDCIHISKPVSVCQNGASILIAPATDFRITYTLDYPDSFLGSQVFSRVITHEVFENEIAPCRTFCLEEEAGDLKSYGLGKGANYENTLVVGKNGVIRNTVRFPDEFARHKVLDILGDLYLLGRPIRGNIFAVKSGHRLNYELLKNIFRQEALPRPAEVDLPTGQGLDISQIMRILPHRFPFLLIDRIAELEPGRRAVGIKNVTVNDPFFRGHFPSRPVMPGVLMVEALAQTGGVMVLTDEAHRGKLALFMAADKVKFRKVVEPGDQLRLEVTMRRSRARTAVMQACARVGEDVVVEAELTFSFTDVSFLD